MVLLCVCVCDFIFPIVFNSQQRNIYIYMKKNFVDVIKKNFAT